MMKKHVILVLALAALVAFSSPLFAQDGKMMFGVKAGLNMANVTGDEAPDETSMKMGAVGGVFMCYKITDIFAIQPELLYTQKGATIDEGDDEFSWKTDYFEIPLLLKVNLPTEGKIKPSLYAGPALGILMSAKYEEEDIKDYLKSTDFGVLAGAGLGYEMEKGMIGIEARYEVGLMTIDEAEGDEEEADIKNSVISVMVFYGFAF
jgi:hypothetical protein